MGGNFYINANTDFISINGGMAHQGAMVDLGMYFLEFLCIRFR